MESTRIKPADMNTRERFHAVMQGRPFDRLPLLEWASWWGETIDRWGGEGLPAEVVGRYAIADHFGLDDYRQHWISPLRAGCPQPKRHLGSVIETMADYEALLPYLYPSGDELSDVWDGMRESARFQGRGEAVVWFTLNGFFWFARSLLGVEPHLYAYYDQPELLHRINRDLADWHLRLITQIGTICAPDFMTFAEDMSYNNGPMLSREQFETFMTPYYHRVVPALRSLGVMPLVDSDGDIAVPAPWFEAAGIEGILPLERQAGVDMVKLRAAHPRMKFIGHFDKMTMTRGEAVMRAEFERLLPTAAQGGFLISCDHQTPPGVSYKDYQVYLKLFREYAEEAGHRSRLVSHSNENEQDV
jgi:hypothetical protein